MTTVLGQLVTPTGENVRSRFSSAPEHFWSPIRHDVWVVDATEVRAVQAPEIPLRAVHGGQPIGRIVHLERRAADGSIWAVAELDDDLRAQGDVYLSVEATYNADDGKDVEIRGASLCAKSAMIGLQPAKLIRNGLDQHGQATWRLGGFQKGLLERATDARKRRRAGDPIVVVDDDPSYLHAAPVASRQTGQIEYRSAELADVSTTQRSLDVLVMPYERSAPVLHHGRHVNEIVARGAFDDIDRDGGRVKVNLNHDRSRAVGRATKFDPDHHDGLWARLKIARTRDGDEALELAREDILDVSAGFGLREHGESWPSQNVRLLRALFLDHIALVSNPAYADARVLAVRDQTL